ncbi:hypothetical protein PG985_005144 [Apiospora marii]|uniref:Uncharacterized protein n=1 Tax=Apiospora marii TaxID=335849 RepID=A0ABR1SCZ1_9PEZI
MAPLASMPRNIGIDALFLALIRTLLPPYRRASDDVGQRLRSALEATTGLARGRRPLCPGFSHTVSQVYSGEMVVPRTPSFGATRFSAAVATTSR